MKWMREYELGIPVIDEQHKRIVDFINELEKAHGLGNIGYIDYVLEGLVDYTLTHFQFEEELQTKAGYQYVKAHKRIHAIFIKRIASFRERFKGGEDVTAELLFMLKTWLASHIKGDDKDYGNLVRGITLRADWVDASLHVPF
jgi:hemerythrin